MDFFVAITFLIAFFVLASILRGAPYLPTRTRFAEQALDLMELEPGELFVDIGCGDGKLLVMAAERGYRVIGYEINPLLVLVAKIRLRKFRSTSKVVWGDMWNKKIPQDTRGVFLFLIPRMMEEMHAKLEAELRDALVVSYAFTFPGVIATKSEEPLFVYKF